MSVALPPPPPAAVRRPEPPPIPAADPLRIGRLVARPAVDGGWEVLDVERVELDELAPLRPTRWGCDPPGRKVCEYVRWRPATGEELDLIAELPHQGDVSAWAWYRESLRAYREARAAYDAATTASRAWVTQWDRWWHAAPAAIRDAIVAACDDDPDCVPPREMYAVARRILCQEQEEEQR